MSDAAPLRLVDDAPAEALEDDRTEQKVLVRQFSTPAGAPWDQVKTATLEARLGAPLPLTEVVWRLQRLEPWRPGRPARFAAFYARAREIGERLETVVEVDGRPVAVHFTSNREQARRARAVAMVGLAVGLVAAATAGSVFVAVSVRGDASDQLAALEPLLAAKTRLAATLERQRHDSRALEAGGLRGRALSDYLSDLAWASAAKAPGARIDALHWDHGLMAVEAHSDAAPFAAGDRVVTKLDKPLRPGVWLWGVSPPGRTPTPRPQVGP